MTLLGHRTDVPDLLAAADVFVLSSRWEARALVAQEALRTGVPLVATDAGGIPELVGDAALLVAPGDDAAFARAVARVLDDPTLADTLRTAGQKQAATWPDEDDAADALKELYDELTSGTTLATIAEQHLTAVVDATERRKRFSLSSLLVATVVGSHVLWQRVSPWLRRGSRSN